MSKLVKCEFCGERTVDRTSADYERYKDKNYHLECAQAQRDRESFSHTVCEVFQLKAPGPTIYSQSHNFIVKYGYTYKGMENCIKYMYDIRKIKDNRPLEAKSIGLIPYYYNEAQEYFKNIERKREIIKNNIEEIEKNKKVIKVILPEKKVKTPRYNIDEIE